MLKITDFEVVGWEHAIRGMRNPMNSWEKSDSGFGCRLTKGRDQIDWKTHDEGEICFCNNCSWCPLLCEDDFDPEYSKQVREFMIGPNDLDLMKWLRNAGTDYRKFMRMITVYVDITAPLYWWKEFDTYKVGTVANSCSTMNKIAQKEFTLEDFSCEHLLQSFPIQMELYSAMTTAPARNGEPQWTPIMHLLSTIAALNFYRERYLDTKDKKYWWQMIQLLPSSYNQKRTVMLNYEVLANIYKSRRNHKLDEWHTFCDWIEELPYSEIITGETSSDTQISQEVVSESTPLFLKKSLILKEGDE